MLHQGVYELHLLAYCYLISSLKFNIFLKLFEGFTFHISKYNNYYLQKKKNTVIINQLYYDISTDMSFDNMFVKFLGRCSTADACF